MKASYITQNSFGLNIKKNKLNKPLNFNWGVTYEIKKVYSRKLERSRIKLADDIKRRC